MMISPVASNSFSERPIIRLGPVEPLTGEEPAEATAGGEELTEEEQREVDQLEKRVGKLEQEQTELEPKLADPELYKDNQRFKQTLDRYQQNKAKLEELYGRWERQQEELLKVEEKMAAELG